MFLHVSVILSTGQSAPLHAGIHTPLDKRQPPLGPEAGTSPGPEAGNPPDQRTVPPPPRADSPLAPEAGTPRHSACWEIRATSGRYASYWNAILIKIMID